MLGELLYEETGNVSGVRVLPPEEGAVVLEVSLQASGRIQGVEHTSLWTYTSTTRADGSIFGQGRGVLTTADGDVVHLVGRASMRPMRSQHPPVCSRRSIRHAARSSASRAEVGARGFRP